MRRGTPIGILAGVAALLVALEAAPGVRAQGKSKSGMYFELYQDKAKEYRWRLKAKNNRIVATSSEGYKNKEDAEHAIKLVQEAGDKSSGLTFDVYQDKAKEYRWRLKAKNSKILATAGDSYKSKADAEHGVELVKSAGKAPVKDLTKK
jgi:uncharacterized protein YegP (UPF0339 family)